MPQIRCPKCGTTINLENRKRVDFSAILNALQRSPRTFTDLLHLTGLPRKTLSLRLKFLCDSGVIIKDGGYRLNGFSPSTKPFMEIFQSLDMGHEWKKLIRVMLLMFIVSIGGSSIVSALMTTQPELPPQSPPVASFTISPRPPYYVGWRNTLTFDASLSYDSDGYITGYQWKFFQLQEYGWPSVIESGNSEGAVTTHVFATPGNYEVILTVTDNEGKSTSAHRRITILPTPCAKVYVSPQTVRGMTIGDSFTVAIVVQDVTELFSWQVGMTYNPDVLECLTINIPTLDEEGNTILGISAFEEGPFLKQGGKTLFVAPWTIYRGRGEILYHCCVLYSVEEPVTSVSGSGTLAYITFKVIGQGDSVLHLTDVMLLNHAVLEIPILSIEDGYFQSP